MAEDSNSTISSLSSISWGAAVFVIGRILSRGLAFAFTVVLTRGLGPAVYGIYALTDSVIKILMPFAKLGADKSILKFVPAKEGEAKRDVVLLSYIVAFLGSTLIFSLLYLGSPYINQYTLNNQILVTALRFAGGLFFIQSAIFVTGSVFRAVDRPELEVFTNKIARQVFLLIAATVAIFLALPLKYIFVLILAGSVATLLTGIGVLKKIGAAPTLRKPQVNFKEYLEFSLPLTLSDGSNFFFRQSDIIMIGIFANSTAVGIYTVATLLSEIVTLSQGAITQMFPSVASKLYADNDISGLSQVYATATRWMFTISLFAALFLSVYPSEVLKIFGNGYQSGQLVLLLIVSGQLVNTLSGPSSYVLMMANHQRFLMALKWLFGIINVIVNYFLIIRYGPVGAALGTGLAIGGVNIMKVIAVRRYEGIHPYSKQFIKPVVAGIGALVIMLVLHGAFDGLMLVITGGLIGGITYLFILYTLGLETEDIELYHHVRSND
ncbi:oligosaccharide flippase family protein [Haloarcula laminariae]|uniref:oligosaccharide flippase family protein n=1 Tax=Haloarcula laminariae TaxID=2961577 RepID=UPI00240523CC|nr:oligosaccharide flippase family protein [Halomicroarcula sp. FL173]